MNDTDSKASTEPSFVHVGIATGSDIDQGAILIADRLCLNRAAVEVLAGGAKASIDQIKEDGAEIEKLKAALKTSDRQFWVVWATAVVMWFVAAILGFGRNRKE